MSHARRPVVFDMAGQPERWTPAMKEQVVLQIHRSQVAAEDVSSAFGISPEELISWAKRFKAHGRNGLKITKLQRYR